ncbi:hypothetical protein PWT90_09621 [Aphanocladium album]|nr:hypothetical protein PWT90_09621 [Aphanocladium album]
MSYSASQFEGTVEAIPRKPGKKIAKDQQELLEKDESWIHQLKRRPHGAGNVPAHVLQTVTAAHEARVKQMASNNRQHLQAARRTEKESSQVHATPTSSPEQFASDWSASPEERRRRDQMLESSRVEETPHIQPAHRKPAPDFKRHAGLPPMSSLEEEEEMEVQLPCGDNEEQDNEGATGQYRYPARFASQQTRQNAVQMANTPPCAQPDHDVIPATVIAETSRALDDKRERPIRRYKPISFGDESPTKTRGDTVASREDRMQSLKRLQVAETQDYVFSSSVVPGTLSQKQSQSAANTTSESAQIVSRQVVDVGSSASAAHVSPSSEPVSAKSQISEDEDMEGSQDAAWTPLHEFGVAYPDYAQTYNGTQLNFVKACLCLEYLRGERALRDYLYDDFIRLFSFKYLDYVNNAGPDQEPLSAIEWFNIQSGRPLYNREIIKNSNIDQILMFYEAEVASIRGLVQQHEKEETAEEIPVLLPEQVPDSMEVDVPKLGADVAEAIVANEEASEEEDAADERPFSQPISQPISQPVSPIKALVEGRSSPPSGPISQPISQPATPIKTFVERGSPPTRPICQPTSQPASPANAVVGRVASASRRTFRPISPSRSPHKGSSAERRVNSAAKSMPPPTSQTASPRNPLPAERRAVPRAAATIAGSVRSPQTWSPQAQGRIFSAAPPSSIRSNTPVGTQYLEELTRRQASTSEEARQRRERMRAVMRKRASAGARSSSSKAGSVV